MYQTLSPKIIDKNLSPEEILDILLDNRHIKDKENFLNPKLGDIKLPNIKKAINLIKENIKNDKNILIYGDYDVDGITATAILWRSLRKLGAKVLPFIPHREKDGYGFNAKSFLRFQEEKKIKFDLLITVDNGILANQEFKKIDCKIIVTDHHLAGDSQPQVDALIHNTELSGSGIAYFLAKSIDKNADIFLSALGTVADCLPLEGDNRNLVFEGLRAVNKFMPTSLCQLFKEAKINKKELSSYDLGFIIGPRINASGRLSDPTDSLRLLCSDNQEICSRYAKILNDYNSKRKNLQNIALEKCLQKINNKDKLLFFADDSYLPGIIGLIAGKLCDKYYKPSIVIAKQKKYSKGSCRSIPEINITQTLRKFSDLFEDIGGHAQAAGFTIKTSNINKLKKQIIPYINQKLSHKKLQPTLTVESQMDISAVKLANIKSISKLEPFGMGNPRPLFIFKDIKITDLRLIGGQKEHLKFKFGNIDALAFYQSELFDKFKIGQSITFIAYLDINIWQNISKPQIIITSVII
jgi:single-stranded-DNA-specific exonuclease